MTPDQLLQYRLLNQHLIKPVFKEPEDLVKWMGAMQAQDYAMAKWGIGLRLKNATDTTIEDAINKGTIIRTHIMRPTWHFVSADDIRWMIDLTAPHISKVTSSMYKLLELNDTVLKRTNKIIQRALEGNKHLTREELMTEVKRAGIKINNLRAIHIMFSAELNSIVCNGIKRDKQFTYALLDERVPITKKLLRDEALAKLANRYFTSHSPATVDDFRWWSGLPASDAKMSLELIKSNLISEKIGSEIYWMPSSNPINTKLNAVHLLPSFDEFMISYKNRSASLDTSFAKKVITTNGIFNPIIIMNGKVIGMWKRTFKKDTVVIELKSFKVLKKSLQKDVKGIAGKFGGFLGKKIILT